MLKRQGVIETWHDRRIVAGEELGGSISAELESAEIVLLLVSPDFLASDYCYDKEMTVALDRQARGEAIVIPVILRPCEWHHAPFGKLRATPSDGKPVTQWPVHYPAGTSFTRMQSGLHKNDFPCLLPIAIVEVGNSY